ncbi:MAG: diguanylate cyclase [Lachnospiraceae bacterium]|nr:diguanylate cyclase [Lachnospiraceae bacterium]
MWYAMSGVVALLILLIENTDILRNRKKEFSTPAWCGYRRFLFSVLVFYITDILWGFFEARRMVFLLFADTTVYFITVALSVLFWTRCVVIYLEEETLPGRILLYTGRIMCVIVAGLSVANIFYPLLFAVDRDCNYTALPMRSVFLAAQIVLLLLVSVYAFSSYLQHKGWSRKAGRYRTVACFGVIMGVFLCGQLKYPYLPLYAIGFLIATCLLRAFVVGDEKEQFLRDLKEADRIRELQESISSLLDNMPGLTFSKDAKTGVYLACNQAFAEYAHKESPDGVVGLTDAQIFDPVTAKHFVEDDNMAISMDSPYIFFEDVPDAAGNQRQFQTTKLKFIDGAGRLCTLGMCQDVTDMVRIQREHATTKEAYEKARSNALIFTHIAQTLAYGYKVLTYIDYKSGAYIEYHTDDESGKLKELRRGPQFFDMLKEEVKWRIHSEDREAFMTSLDQEALQKALAENKLLNYTYRFLTDDGPVYYRMHISLMEDDDRHIIIGLSDVDEEIKQQRAAERVREEHIAYARINALAGDFLCVYVVVPETGRYRRYSTTVGFKGVDLPTEGDDFFGPAREGLRAGIHYNDVERFMAAFTRENVVAEVERAGIFALSFRYMIDDKPNFVQIKAAMVDEADGRRLIIGVSDINVLVRQEEEYAKRLAQAQNKVNIDALTGVKTKHAYLDEEAKLDRLIQEGRAPKFAIVILDVNDLKRINDTAGHQAGDHYICDACSIICDTFKKSPVFRVGGDEFAVIVRGSDYKRLDELVYRLRLHNNNALRDGGIVIACGRSVFDDDENVAAVFDRADREMYENKKELKG